jgi:hypothetical protein
MSAGAWHKGYQEVRNVIHNEIGITKEDILEVFRQVAKDEIEKMVSEKKTFIYDTIYHIIHNEIRNEIMSAVKDHKYPKVRKNIWYYTDEESFKDYIAGVIKEEVVNSFWNQFNVKMDIDKKV